MKTNIVRVISIFLLVIVFTNVASQPGPAAAAAQTTTPPSGSIAPEELEVFLDGLLAAEMADNHVPGATVAVVKDGRLLLAKGYGYADLEGKVPVDAERTLFHIASLSQLFVWTAGMQLLEQGKLSLDTDINEYLDFAIPTTFPEPITLRHLLSHTSGFENKALEMWKLQAEQISPLGDYLKKNLPARIFPPGEIVSYSNYGASLAGYIVERVSGLPFSEYAEQNIFEPLGMTRSSFLQPLPEPLEADLAKGYNYTKGQYVEGSPFLQSYPSGSLSATAADMARFMIAHLQKGELDGQRILQEETALKMHSRLYTPDPRLDGMAHGFNEHMVNGQRIISHGGNYLTYISSLYLIPDKNVGFFISTNSAGGDAVTATASEAFLDHYYPAADSSDPQSPADFAERIAPYLGQYTSARGNFTSFEKVKALFSPLSARLADDGTLELASGSRAFRFADVEPGLLQQIGEPANRIVYRTNPDGRRILTGSIGILEPFTLIRTPWYGTGSLHLSLFLSGTVLFVVALVVWPIAYVAGRRKGSPEAQANPLPGRLGRWAAALFGLLLVVSLLGIAYIFADILPEFGVPRIWLETPPILNVFLAISYVLAGLALAMAVFAVLAWVRRYWSLTGRIFYTLLALMALLITWSLAYWKLFL